MGKYFLFDHRFQSRRENIDITIGPCVKHPGNPLKVDGSTFWCDDELRGRIRYFPEENEYRGNVYQQPGVYSTDGLEWRTGPEWMGAYEIEGDPDLQSGGDPSRRYKIVYHPEKTFEATEFKNLWCYPAQRRAPAELGLDFSAPAGVGLGWSADGKRWVTRHLIDQDVKWWYPGCGGWCGGDGYNHVIWAPTLNRYVLFLRTNIDQGRWGTRRERGVGRLDSEDFVRWSEHECVFRTPVSWQGALGYGKHDIYHFPVFFHEGLYLSIVGMFHWRPDIIRLELVWSPDTYHWERVCPNQDFIPQGEPGETDGGLNFAMQEPVFLGDEVRVYYGGTPNLHNAAPMEGRTNALCLATFKRDRFAGAAPRGAGPGRILTGPLTFDGKSLHLNADAPAGELRAELQSEEGQPLPGFSLAECQPVTGDSLDATLSWKNGSRAPAGKIKVLFQLQSATLYTFWVS